MLAPRKAPSIYRQGDAWHQRAQVPKSVAHLVEKGEIHRSLHATDRRKASRRAEIERANLYDRFDSLLEEAPKTPERRGPLTDVEADDIARNVYLDYRSEVLKDLGEFLLLTSEEQAESSILEVNRSRRLMELLDDFDLAEASRIHTNAELRKRRRVFAPPETKTTLT